MYHSSKCRSNVAKVYTAVLARRQSDTSWVYTHHVHCLTVGKVQGLDLLLRSSIGAQLAVLFLSLRMSYMSKFGCAVGVGRDREI